MSKQWTPRKQTVELKPAARPSRIRRDPARDPKPEHSLAGKLNWRSSEWEVRVVIIGVALFALAIDALVLGVSAITN